MTRWSEDDSEDRQECLPGLLEVVQRLAHVLQGQALPVVHLELVDVLWAAVVAAVCGRDLGELEAFGCRLDEGIAVAWRAAARIGWSVQPTTGPVVDLLQVVVHAAAGEVGAALLRSL